MNQLCDVTFQVADIEAAVDWYRSNFDTNVAHFSLFRARLQLDDVSLTLVLRGAQAADREIKAAA